MGHTTPGYQPIEQPTQHLLQPQYSPAAIAGGPGGTCSAVPVSTVTEAPVKSIPTYNLQQQQVGGTGNVYPTSEARPNSHTGVVIAPPVYVAGDHLVHGQSVSPALSVPHAQPHQHSDVIIAPAVYGGAHSAEEVQPIAAEYLPPIQEYMGIATKIDEVNGFIEYERPMAHQAVHTAPSVPVLGAGGGGLAQPPASQFANGLPVGHGSPVVINSHPVVEPSAAMHANGSYVPPPAGHSTKPMFYSYSPPPMSYAQAAPIAIIAAASYTPAPMMSSFVPPAMPCAMPSMPMIPMCPPPPAMPTGGLPLCGGAQPMHGGYPLAPAMPPAAAAVPPALPPMPPVPPPMPSVPQLLHSPVPPSMPSAPPPQRMPAAQQLAMPPQHQHGSYVPYAPPQGQGSYVPPRPPPTQEPVVQEPYAVPFLPPAPTAASSPTPPRPPPGGGGATVPVVAGTFTLANPPSQPPPRQNYPPPMPNQRAHPPPQNSCYGRPPLPPQQYAPPRPPVMPETVQLEPVGSSSGGNAHLAVTMIPPPPTQESVWTTIMPTTID